MEYLQDEEAGLNMGSFRRSRLKNIVPLAAAALLFGAGAHFLQAQQVTPSNWQLGPFVRPEFGPVIRPDPNRSFRDPFLQEMVPWQALHTFNPAAIVRHGRIYVLYRAEDNSGSLKIGMHTSRLGLAISKDGIHFKTRDKPVFYPANDAQQGREWPGGVEDPRLVESGGGEYVLTYTQWNRNTYSVGVATSPDLLHWTKYGPAFGEKGKYAELKYKSAGIVSKLSDGHLVAARIKGRYWMYWGEVHVHLATSPDLIHWTPVEDEAGQPAEILSARPGLFDSSFPEVGPPPLLTDRGIVVIYNGKNAASGGDPTLDANAYAAGQALFSSEDPAKLLARDEKPFFFPQKMYERQGQYQAGTTFSEGLVWFKKRWFLYYGCADSLVGVAIFDPAK